MADDSRGWEFLTGFLLGAVVGAAAALLMAPQSGEETREQIRERGIELRSRASEVGEEGRKRAEELAMDARARAEAPAYTPRRATRHSCFRALIFRQAGPESIAGAPSPDTGIRVRLPSVLSIR